MKALFVLFTFCFLCSAQNSPDIDPFEGQSRWVLGGSLGFDVGDVTVVSVLPRIGYRFTPEFTASLGAGYRYYSDDNTEPSLTQNIYSGVLNVSQRILPNVLIMAEGDYTSWERATISSAGKILSKERTQSPGALVGAAYRAGVQGGLGFQLEVLYDLLFDEEDSFRNKPFVIRGGINIAI